MVIMNHKVEPTCTEHSKVDKCELLMPGSSRVSINHFLGFSSMIAIAGTIGTGKFYFLEPLSRKLTRTSFRSFLGFRSCHCQWWTGRGFDRLSFR